MIGSVILPGTTPDEWPAIRQEIHGRVAKTLGTAPAAAGSEPPAFKEIERYERFGLTHVKLKYHVVDDEWHEAIFVLPEGGEEALPAPAVICMHATFGRIEGKYGVLDPEISASRVYGLELSKRGHLAIATDMYAFGENLHGRTNPEAVADFAKEYPDWTLDGRRILDHQRALDVAAKLDWVKDGVFGAVGDSLGGRGVMFLAAFDERIAAAVSSTGISPHLNNIVRHSVGPGPPPSLKLTDPAEPLRRAPWDYHELIALCAPRALLAFEATNDRYNPNCWPAMQCFYCGSDVYKLLGHPEALRLVIHGEGHDTPADLREFAYTWLDRFLKAPKSSGPPSSQADSDERVAS